MSVEPQDLTCMFAEYQKDVTDNQVYIPESGDLFATKLLYPRTCIQGSSNKLKARCTWRGTGLCNQVMTIIMCILYHRFGI